MNALLTGIQTYIQSWQAPMALVVIMFAAYLIIKRHPVAAALEMLAGMALLYTATQIAGQFGL